MAIDMAISALRAQDVSDINVGDMVSRRKAIDAMCWACGHDCDKSKFVYNAPRDEQVIMCPEHYALSTLPSAQPEVRPIDYQDCSNAMLKMWMDNVVTDGEYNRIMDKLNAHWGKKDG